MSYARVLSILVGILILSSSALAGNQSLYSEGHDYIQQQLDFLKTTKDGYYAGVPDFRLRLSPLISILKGLHFGSASEVSKNMLTDLEAKVEAVPGSKSY